MKALILNSGLGSRMGDATKDKPKCMTELDTGETIISRQLKILKDTGITEIVITTGPFEEILKTYIDTLNTGLNISFVHNSKYKETNYIYSIFLAKDLLEDDILLLHGDLVFTKEVVNNLLRQKNSGVIVDYSAPLPEKDFKAVIRDGRVTAIGIEFFERAVACQPLYYLLKEDWSKWLQEIVGFIDQKVTNCYAENALNKITNTVNLKPVDSEGEICREIDCEADLKLINHYLITG